MSKEAKIVGGSLYQEDYSVIVKKIDKKMGDGWAGKFANVLNNDMVLTSEVIFTFEKFDGSGDYKYSSKRRLK